MNDATDTPPAPIKDTYGRPMQTLRISVTDRCNLNCWYCRGRENFCELQHQDLLRYEEITEIARIFVRLGVKKIRLTGGEPLVRPELHQLIKQLKNIKKLQEVTLTTNGYRLEDEINTLVAAGLDRINMSLDTFEPEKFQQLTGKNTLPKILRGLKKLSDATELHPLKINTVAIRGFNDDEIHDFVGWAKKNGHTARFIEFMPLEKGELWKRDGLLLSEEIKAIIENKFRLTAINNSIYDTDTKYRIDDSNGKVGFITSVSKPFCKTCDRIRMTADGKIKSCLFSYEEQDIKGLLRRGQTDQLQEAITLIYKNKWEGGCCKLQNGDYNPGRQSRTMSQIGG